MTDIETLTGFLLINKPQGLTSFQCVYHIKKIIKDYYIKQSTDNSKCPKIKIGHSGTLDPFATGLLIICIGRTATREISPLLNLDKTYKVTAKLGELTDTLDLTGTIMKTTDKPFPDARDIEQAIASLGEEYVQVPPIYSALKHSGKPLYKLAREGKVDIEKLDAITEEKSRLVKLYALRLTEYMPPFFSFTAHVSKGAYIRSLANDIAKQIGQYATTYELERTAIGSIELEQAIDLNSIKTIQDIESHLLEPETLKSLLSTNFL